MDFHLIIEDNSAILRKLDQLIGLVTSLIAKDTKMASALDDLTSSVSNETTVEKSALVLINGFAAQLAAAGTDPAKLSALKATLDANNTELAAAVAANTPAAPTS